MPTSFVTTTFVVLVGLNNYGGLAPVDKSLLPPGTPGAILWSVDQCNMVRGKMVDPQKYTCQMFTSAKETAWTYTPEGATGVVAPPPPQENLQPDTSPEHRSEAPSKPEPAKEIESKNDVQVGGLENAPARVVMHKITNGFLPQTEPFETMEGCEREAAYLLWKGKLREATCDAGEPALPQVKEQAPKPKQVAKRTTGYREQQQAMLDGPNPFRALFNW